LTQRRPRRRSAPLAPSREASSERLGAGLSAVAIDGVVPARVDAFEAAQRHLVARVVADVDDRDVEDRAAQRVDGDAAAPDPVRERVGALADVGARLAASDDVVLADAVEDPAG